MANEYKVAVITVTYGQRWHLLERVIDAVLKVQPAILSLVVVDNGSEPGIAERLSQYQSGNMVLISLSDNTGSANGFGEGLRAALDRTRAEVFWLLDDDNVPQPGSLRALLGAHQELGGGPDIALLSWREGLQRRFTKAASRGTSLQGVRVNGFSGFHLADLPEKVFSRLLKARTTAAAANKGLLECEFAPYGGLFVHREAVLRGGLPDARFFVYADDLEFTLRLRKQGVRIFLCPSSVIQDIDSHWHDKLNRFCPHLSLGADTDRVYYLIRNSTFVELQYGVTMTWLYLVNMAAYLTFGALLNLARERSPVFVARRLSLILRAVRDGWSGRLGRIEAWPSS
jgi:GT2 family glycosyltransferase